MNYHAVVTVTFVEPKNHEIFYICLPPKNAKQSCCVTKLQWFYSLTRTISSFKIYSVTSSFGIVLETNDHLNIVRPRHHIEQISGHSGHCKAGTIRHNSLFWIFDTGFMVQGNILYAGHCKAMQKMDLQLYESSTSLWKLGKSFNWCPWKVLDCVNFLKIWSISKSQQWRHLSALLTYCFWTSRWISKGWTCWYFVCCVGSLPIGHLHMRKWH